MDEEEKYENEKIDEHIKDLERMAESAYDFDDCKGKDCRKCEDLSKCLRGLRNAIGDLAQSQATILKNIKELDSTLFVLVKKALGKEVLVNEPKVIKKKTDGMYI